MKSAQEEAIYPPATRAATLDLARLPPSTASKSFGPAACSNSSPVALLIDSYLWWKGVALRCLQVRLLRWGDRQIARPLDFEFPSEQQSAADTSLPIAFEIHSPALKRTASPARESSPSLGRRFATAEIVIDQFGLLRSILI